MSLTASTVATLASTADPGSGHDPWQRQTRGLRDLYTQLVVSAVLGLSAFLAFCVRIPFSTLDIRYQKTNMGWG